MSQDVWSPGWQVGKSRLVARGGARRGEAEGALLFTSSQRGGHGDCGHRAVASPGRAQADSPLALSPADSLLALLSPVHHG